MATSNVKLPELDGPSVVTEGGLTVLTVCNRPSPVFAVSNGVVETLEPPCVAQAVAVSGSTLYLCGMDGVVWTTRGPGGWSEWKSFAFEQPSQVLAMSAAGDLCVVLDFQKRVEVFRRTGEQWERAWARSFSQVAAIHTDGQRVAIATRVSFPAPRETHHNQILVLTFADTGEPAEGRIELPLLLFPTSLAILEGAVVFGEDRESTGADDSGAVFRCEQRGNEWVLSKPIKLPGARPGERFGAWVQRVSGQRFAATTQDSTGKSRLGLFELGRAEPLFVSAPVEAVAVQVGGEELVEVFGKNLTRTPLPA